MSVFSLFKKFKGKRKTYLRLLVVFGVVAIIMVSFFSFNKSKSLLPQDRFSFMPQKAQEAFINDLQDYFRDKSDFKINLAQGVIEGPENMQYGLDNVAQQYYVADKYDNADSSEKKKVVSNHFNTLFKSQQEEKEILKNMSDYSHIKKYIAVRLYPPDYLHSIGEDGFIYRKDLEGVVTALVLDLPSTVVNIKPEHMKEWKVSKDELFALGFKNTYANNKIELIEHKIGDKVPLWQIGSDNLFAATYVYNLSKYPKTYGKYGSLISVPHRHALLVVPINDKSIVAALNQFIIVTDGMFKEGPGSISPNIFWYHDEKFINLPYSLDVKNKKFDFSPPEKFVEMINKVVEEKN